MVAVNKFKRHGGSAINGIFNTAGRTKTSVASKGSKFKLATVRASIHGTAKSRIPTVDHLINGINNDIARMKQVTHFFVVVFKDILKYTHKTIIEEK